MEVTRVDSRARASRSHLALGWSQARWIEFGSGHLEEKEFYKKTSVCI